MVKKGSVSKLISGYFLHIAQKGRAFD
uniref:Uncharacterized protein n=1 Tax=Arundo donax TaxID=35708 RepID=A0A0A9EYG7_ARUDO